MTALPGFSAHRSLPRSQPSHAGRATRQVLLFDDAAQSTPPSDAAVTPAQLDWTSLLKEGYRERVQFGIDCPPGHLPKLVTECVWSLPIYECTWLGGGGYTCRIKRWECQQSRETWQCRQVGLSIFKP